MKTFKMKISDLNHPEKNIRIHTEKQLAEFERSIRMFGQIRPVVIDEKNTILAGNGLVLTLKRMGEEEVIVIKYTNLSENQKKKLMIADNKIFNLGIEDLDTLNHFLEELGDDLDIPGFDEELLQTMVAEAEEVTEKIAEYGTLDQDEINRIKANKVIKDNLILLTRSIFVNGWTLPIVVRPNNTIVDGFHRWTVAGPEWDYVPKFTAKEQQELKINPEHIGKTLYEILGGKVPVVTVKHQDESTYIYGTITHNRARGTHLLEPMKAIVKRLFDAGKTVDEISKELGMKAEEVFRLSDFTREDFLQIMVKGEEYSNAEWITKI